MQNNMESALKRHESNIQGFANSMQKKMQNNGYLSEASYKQDQDKIASMQNSAQRDAANLQNNFQNAAMKAQQTVNDSIEAFIKEYNAKRGYDAILFKAATLYINPELDITDEVVEGLNARYNKVKKWRFCVSHNPIQRPCQYAWPFLFLALPPFFITFAPWNFTDW